MPTKKAAPVKRTNGASKSKPTGPPAVYVRCRFCQKKALPGQDVCGDPRHPTIRPVVRGPMRTGRGAFLRMLRARIARVPQGAGVDRGDHQRLLDRVLRVVDEASAKYTGE